MLTQLEIRTLNIIYGYTCRPVFGTGLEWKNSKLIIQPRHNNLCYNCITWFLQLSTLGFRIMQIPALVEAMDINGVVINGILLIAGCGNAVFKLNRQLYGVRLAHLVNQTFHANSCWGMLLLLSYISQVVLPPKMV